MATIELSDIVLPPEITDDFEVRDITSQITSQGYQQTTGCGIGRDAYPTETQAAGIQLVLTGQDRAPQTELAAQLVQLIRSSATSGDSLARAPLIELLKHQAEQVPATAYQQTTPIWQLTDDRRVHQAIQEQIEQQTFGRESDAVCGWLYDWSRSGDPLLQRFVARSAPHLAVRYLLHCLSNTDAEAVPGLEACLIAMYEVRMATAEIFRLPDMSQPSVYHQPASTDTGKADMHQGLSRQPSTFSPKSPSYNTLPTGVAALFGASKTGQPKVMAGIHAWQRNAVVGAALQTFCSWMVTFSDDAMIDLSRLALALATCGCPWLRAESQHLLQEQLQHDPYVQTLHTPHTGKAYRAKLSAELLNPLCQALGHAIYRLTISSRQQPNTQTAAMQLTSASAYAQNASAAPSTTAASPLLPLVTEAVAALHARTTHDLSAGGVLLTQSLMAQLQQFYRSVP